MAHGGKQYFWTGRLEEGTNGGNILTYCRADRARKKGTAEERHGLDSNKSRETILLGLPLRVHLIAILAAGSCAFVVAASVVVRMLMMDCKLILMNTNAQIDAKLREYACSNAPFQRLYALSCTLVAWMLGSCDSFAVSYQDCQEPVFPLVLRGGSPSKMPPTPQVLVLKMALYWLICEGILRISPCICVYTDQTIAAASAGVSNNLR